MKVIKCFCEGGKKNPNYSYYSIKLAKMVFIGSPVSVFAKVSEKQKYKKSNSGDFLSL